MFNSLHRTTRDSRGIFVTDSPLPGTDGKVRVPLHYGLLRLSVSLFDNHNTYVKIIVHSEGEGLEVQIFQRKKLGGPAIQMPCLKVSLRKFSQTAKNHNEIRESLPLGSQTLNSLLLPSPQLSLLTLPPGSLDSTHSTTVIRVLQLDPPSNNCPPGTCEGREKETLSHLSWFSSIGLHCFLVSFLSFFVVAKLILILEVQRNILHVEKIFPLTEIQNPFLYYGIYDIIPSFNPDA